MAKTRNNTLVARAGGLGLGCALVIAGACVPDAGIECKGGKCDSLASFEDLLEGKGDPIASFLRSAADPGGQLEGDFATVTLGVASVQGCSEDSWKSFVVSDALIEELAFPRVVSTVCNENQNKAAEFFIAASFKDPEEDDVDPHRLEMFAWDPELLQYNFYKTSELANGLLQVTPDPDECRGCHLTPANLSSGGMRMTPIMNELSQPWSHWSSEVPMFSGTGIPFRSHDFHVPEHVREADDFTRLAVDHIAQAQVFEELIRKGHEKAVGSRLRDRRLTTDDWRVAMNLLRPLYCDEQLQYATEDFETGLLKMTALVPGGIREAFRAHTASGWPWEWINNQSEQVRLPAPVGETIAMMPIRGNADIMVINRLMTPSATAVLTPTQVLQVLALDWKRPVLSSFRCGLWKDALVRFESQGPELGLSGRVSEQMKALYPLIMTVDGVPLQSGQDDTFVALDLASDESVSAMLQGLQDKAIPSTCAAEGDACEVTLQEFGDMLDDYVQTFVTADSAAVRTRLAQMREERLCQIVDAFGAAPALPPITCDDASDGDASFGGQNQSPVPIPDNDPMGASSTIEVDADLALGTVEIAVQIDHSWRGDLALSLTAPSGEIVPVVELDRGDSQDDIVARFSVSGLTAGQPCRGAWTLTAVDRAARDTGVLDRWSLGINQQAP